LGFKAELVFLSSTGIIGVPMPVSKILAALPTLVAAHEASEHAVMQFARAIMTTDTRPKLASAEFQVRGKNSSILGIAKGSGKIAVLWPSRLFPMAKACSMSSGSQWNKPGAVRKPCI